MSQKKKQEKMSGLLTPKNQADQLAQITGALPDAEPEKRQAVEPSSRKPDSLANEQTVTVGAKVYKTLAYYWTAQAKLKRQSVSDVVRQALVDAFGLPEDFPPEAVRPENRKDGKTD